MVWTKRLLIAMPFVMAAVLNVLVLNVDRFHLRREHIAAYFFAFGTPWAWLLDGFSFGDIHDRWLMRLIGFAVVLWIPAVLYSGCLWLLLAALRAKMARHSS